MKNNNDLILLNQACNLNDYFTVKDILSRINVTDITNKLQYLIAIIILEKKDDIFDIFASDNRIDLTYENNLFLNNAVEYGSTEIVKRILKDPNVDPSKNNNYCLNKAMEHSDYDTIDVLLKDDRVIKAINPEKMSSYVKYKLGAKFKVYSEKELINTIKLL